MKIIGYSITLINPAKDFITLDVKGSKIKREDAKRLKSLRKPSHLYFDDVQWIATGCNNWVKSLDFEIN